MYNPNNTRLQNRIHLNCAFEKENGVIKKSTVMVNIFEWNVSSAIKLYRDILKELSEEAPVIVSENENNKPVQLNTKKIEFLPECPDHHIKMVERVRKVDGMPFFGCPLYRNGCKRTTQHPINQEIITRIPIKSG
jgi:hypothetical protein